METDRTETENIAKKYPALPKELEEEWNSWADRCGVISWDYLKANLETN